MRILVTLLELTNSPEHDLSVSVLDRSPHRLAIKYAQIESRCPFTIKYLSVGDINTAFHSVTLNLWVNSFAKPVSDAF
jgi:hypothetical protein